VLSPRQIKFCEEYIIDHNATSAAVRAGYTYAGARNTGCRLLQLPEVQARVAELDTVKREKYREKFEKTTEELEAMAFSNIGDFIGPNETGIGLLLESGEKMRPVASFDVATHTHHTNVRIKMYDKLKALKMLAKHLGFYELNKGDIEECAVRTLLREQGFERLLNEENNIPLEPGNPELDAEELK